MDEINIEGVILTPLKKIHHPKGDVLHGLKKSDAEYSSFGEAYFSTINNGEIRIWSLVIAFIFLVLGILNSKILTPLNNVSSILCPG